MEVICCLVLDNYSYLEGEDLIEVVVVENILI